MSNSYLSIIIVSYNVKDYLLAAIESIRRTCADLDPEIIVVDNNSTDGTKESLKSIPGLKVIDNDSNKGFAAANNQGYKISTRKYVLLLNPDTVLKPDAVKNVLEFMEKTPDAGIAGCRMVGEDGRLQKTIKRLPSVWDNILQAFFLDRLFYNENRESSYYRKEPFKIGYPGGAFMMVRRSAIGNEPLLNENYFMYSEEKDLALRLKKSGYGCYFVPGAEIIHYGEKSTSQMPTDMYLELQKSQIKYFNLYAKGFYKKLLILSYWILLFVHLFAACLVPFTGYGRQRIKLLFKAVIKYPIYCYA